MGFGSFKPIQNIGLHIKSLFLEVCVKETGGLGHADEAEGDQKHYKVVKTPAQGKRQPLNLCIRIAAQLCNQAVNKDQHSADGNDAPRRPRDSGKGSGSLSSQRLGAEAHKGIAQISGSEGKPHPIKIPADINDDEGPQDAEDMPCTALGGDMQGGVQFF